MLFGLPVLVVFDRLLPLFLSGLHLRLGEAPRRGDARNGERRAAPQRQNVVGAHLDALRAEDDEELENAPQLVDLRAVDAQCHRLQPTVLQVVNLRQETPRDDGLLGNGEQLLIGGDGLRQGELFARVNLKVTAAAATSLTTFLDHRLDGLIGGGQRLAGVAAEAELPSAVGPWLAHHDLIAHRQLGVVEEEVHRVGAVPQAVGAHQGRVVDVPQRPRSILAPHRRKLKITPVATDELQILH